MSDPLSIAASIAGLVALADVVFGRVVKYGRGVKEAEKEIQELTKEVNLLAGALSSLSRLARTLEDELFDRNLRMHHIEACNETLADINKKMSKIDKNSIKDRLKWPFSTRRVKEWLEELSQHKENINLALSANTMDAMLRLLAQEGCHAEGIQTEVKETRQIVSRISQDLQRTNVLNYFLKYNPQQNYEMSRRLRHPRTGLWLTRLPEFQHWLSTPGSKLWLKGIPGAGKTVLAGSIIEAALQRSTEATPSTFFFCDYKNPTTHRPDAVLSALVYQLAIQKEAAYKMLEQLYQELHPLTGLPRDASTKALEQLLKTMASMYDHVYLVIDGLDECAEFTEEVIEVLSDISDDTENISMALISRDEDHIQHRLETDFVPIEIAAHKEDITEYVTSEIEERTRNRKLRIDSAELKGEILHGLVDGAKGMFRWVACQLDHLEDCDSDYECRKALETLPPTLNETYVRILERIPKNKTRVIQLALNCIAYASPMLTAHELRQILSVPDTGGSLDRRAIIREEAIMKYCRSLIRRSNDGVYLEFSHFSVQEFLENGSQLKSELEPFRVSRPRAYSLLAIECLRFIQLENFQGLCVEEDQIERRNKEYPMYRHAAVYWPLYPRERSEDARVADLAKPLFHPSKTPCFTSWAVSFAWNLRIYTRSSLKDLVTIIVHHNFSTLHLASSLSLPEVCSYLVQQKMDVNLTSPVGTPIQCAVQGFSASWEPLRDNHLKWFQDTTYNKARHELAVTAETISCLHRAGASFPSKCTAPFAGNTLFEVAFHVASITDTLFLPMTLLHYGVPPEDRDLGAARYILARMTQRGRASFQPFIESLNDSFTQSPLEIRLHQLVWAEAVRNNLEFTRHPTSIDTRVYLTEENMGEQTIAAIHSGNHCVLQRVLNDSRFDASTFEAENGISLLHLALQSQAIYKHDLAKIIKLLLAAGCNISRTNQAGELPLHLGNLEFDEDGLVSVEMFSEMIEALMERGANCLWQDQNGRNILHVHVTSPQRINVLLAHFPTSSIMKAMETMDNDGYTPLSRALANDNLESALIMAERILLTPEMTHSPTHILFSSMYYITEHERQVCTLASRSLVRLEYLHSYESWTGQSAIIPFFEEFGESELGLIPSELIFQIIKKTRHWSDIEKSQRGFRLFEAAVLGSDVNLTRLLLSKGVSVHRRFKDHADKSRWNETNPASNGQALIHQLEFRGGEWIIDELIRRGADPDVRVCEFPHEPALVHHIVKNRIDYAITLLENGANPNQACRQGFDAALASA
ncbi:ankyrin, partial [Colletotrichum sublineola]